MKNSTNFIQSNQIIYQITTYLIDQSYSLLRLNQIKNKIPLRAQQYLNNIVHQILQINQFKHQQIYSHDSQMDPQANSVVLDNFMPGSLNFGQKQIFVQRRNQGQGQQKIDDQNNSIRKNMKSREVKKKRQQNEFKFLQIQKEQEDDRITKFLRDKKSSDYNMSNAMNQNKLSKNINKQFNQKKLNQFAFDFNGEVFKTKIMQPTNLIRSSIQIDINQQINQNQKLNSVTTVQIPNLLPGINKKVKSTRQNGNEEIIAPMNQIPIDIFELAQGAKIITNKKTQQNIRKQIELADLQQKHKQMRLTKEDYFRLKQIKNKHNKHQQKIQNKQKQKSKQEVVNKELVTITKQFKNLKTIKSTALISQKYNTKEKITISNTQLKSINLHQFEEQQVPVQYNIPNKKSLENDIVPVDRHLEFLLKKNNVPLTSSTQKIQLPEIKRTNIGIMLKTRSKLKNEKQILIEINKKFEDRLRSNTTINLKRN